MNIMKGCQTGERPSCKQIDNLKNIISSIPDDETLYKQSEVIKAISDPTRLKILYLLEYGELCACEIITALEKPQPTISHHLNVLKTAGFLKWRKEGVWIHYSLSDSKIIEKLNALQID
jgi:ArsR family transcriptional regulator